MSNQTPFESQVDAWLLGQLSQDEEAAFTKALAHDDTLQAAVAQAEEALATVWLAESESVEPPRPVLFERLLASTSPSSSGVMGFASTLMNLLDITLEHAKRLLAEAMDPDAWLPGPGPGTHLVHIDDVPLSESAIVGFVKIEPGHNFPHHEHAGVEQTFVLSGILKDGDTLYHRGQRYVVDPQSEHTIEAYGDEDAIYLTIADCGIKFGEFFIGPGDPEV